MKILIVDNDITGHHNVYLNNILQHEFDYVFILPEYLKGLERNKQYIYKGDIHSFIGYKKWIRFIHRVSQDENVDIVHFLNADPLIRYFGLFLGLLKNDKIIGTFHHFTYSTLRNIARKTVFSKIDYGVVHTDFLYEVTRKSGIKNCVQIEYPVFESFEGITKSEARTFFGIPDNSTKVIAAIGGTREPKGLDILVEALNYVNDDFYLLIAGKEEFFTKNYIEQNIKSYQDKVIMYLKYLTDEEFKMAMCSSDIIVLPYRKSFDGASGPLAEGASLGKCIVGPAHGSLGRIISKYHLGYTFEPENTQSLARTIENSIRAKFIYDEVANEYCNKLEVDTFKRNYLSLYKGR